MGRSSPWDFNSVLFQHFEDSKMLSIRPSYLIPSQSSEILMIMMPHLPDEQTEAWKEEVTFTREQS